MQKLLYFFLILTAVNCPAQTVQLLKPQYYHDLTGYAGPEGDPNKPLYLYDAFGFVDPRNGNTTFPAGHRGDTTFGLSSKQYDKYYPNGIVNVGQINYPVSANGGRGERVVLDMVGAFNGHDTTKKVHLSALYAYRAPNIDAGDTLYFYNLDVMFTVSIAQRRWMLARPDSLLTPIAKIVTQHFFAGQWDSAVVNIDCRYIMIRTVLNNRGSYQTTAVNYAELCFYGYYNYTPSTVVGFPTNALIPQNKKPYGQWVGTNLGQGFDTLQLQYDQNIRVYGSAGYFDYDATKTTPASAVFHDPGFADIGPTQYAAFNRSGQIMWWSIKGVNAWLNSLGHNTLVNINYWGDDPEIDTCYTRDGRMYGAMADIWAAYGLKRMEGPNERNYLDGPLACFNQWCPEYDSVKAHQPTMRFLLGPTTELDTCLYQTYIWLAQVLRPNDNSPFYGNLPFDDFNFHHYPRVFPNGVPGKYLDHQYGNSEGVGAHAQSPEGDQGIGVHALYTQSIQAVYNYLNGDTSHKIYDTEYGFGNWAHAASTPTESAYPWDCGNMSPGLFGAWDSLQYKAILMARSELSMCFSPLASYNEYFFHNSSFGANNNILFTSYGRTTGRNSGTFQATTFFPWWYYRACIYGRLKWYVPISITGQNDTTGICVNHWQKMDSATGNITDSTCDVVWKTSMQGVTVTRDVTIGYRKFSSVEQWIPSFTAITGTSSTASVYFNKIQAMTVSEAPVFFFGKVGAQLWNSGHSSIIQVH